VARADHIVLPGVGAFGDCAQGLTAIDGLRAALETRVVNDARPFLGICVGMQLMFTTGTERGQHEGLGWFEGSVDALNVAAPLKVPHMGWNTLHMRARHGVFDGLDGADFYFVHGYAARPKNQIEIAAETDYGGPVVAALARGNMVGTQFHPEKSQMVGLRLIENFVNWKP
jgi:glutamine amidotransferase